MCEKQCRDANGMKNHQTSMGHLENMKKFASHSQSYLKNFSGQFEKGFLDLLSRRLIGAYANQVYDEYIRDGSHVHMNSTKWSTLTSFVHDLHERGKIELEEREMGIFVKMKEFSSSSKNVIGKRSLPRSSSTDEEGRLKLNRQLASIVSEDISASSIQREPEKGSIVGRKKKRRKIAVLPEVVDKLLLEKERVPPPPVAPKKNDDDQPSSTLTSKKYLPGMVFKIISSKVGGKELKNKKVIVIKAKDEDDLLKVKLYKESQRVLGYVPVRRLETVIPKRGYDVWIFGSVGGPRKVLEIRENNVLVEGSNTAYDFDSLTRFVSP